MIGAIGANVAGNLIAAPLLNGLNGNAKPFNAPQLAPLSGGAKPSVGAVGYGFVPKTVPVSAEPAASPINTVGYTLPTGEQSYKGTVINKVPSFLNPLTPAQQETPCTGCAQGNLDQMGMGDPRKQQDDHKQEQAHAYNWTPVLVGAAAGAAIGYHQSKLGPAMGAVAGAVVGWLYGAA